MDDTEALDLELIKKKAISGVVTFTFRTLFVQAFTFVATFALTILLNPSVFGIFFVVSALLNLFIYFSDIGLAAALVQKKEPPNQDDFSTTFIIQQTLIFTLVVLGFLFSSKIASFYKLDSQGLLLLRMLIFSLVLSSLKTIPSILLERKLSFTRLVIPQVAENVVFYSTAVTLAYLKFGIASFTWAVLARGIIGLILIYILSPWRPSLKFNKKSAKLLTSFGIPFQLNSILALFKDDLLTVFLGKILPFSQVGYIGWGQKWAYTPLRIFMDNVNKIAFPTYSRLQEFKKELSLAIEKSVFFVVYLVYPSIFGLMAIAPKAIEVIPRYQKWEPALPLLYFFGINVLFSAVSTTFTNALFAMGKPKIVLNLMIFWTVATWVFTYPLILKFGFVGVGMASALVALTSISTIYFVKKEIQVKVLRNIFIPLFISFLMFLGVRGILGVLPQNIFGLILSMIAGAIIYFAMTLAVLKKHLLEDVKVVFNSLIFNK